LQLGDRAGSVPGGQPCSQPLFGRDLAQFVEPPPGGDHLRRRPRYVTRAEWDALNAKAREAIPKSRLAFVFVGSILEEASPRETKMFLAQLPAPARVLWRMVGAGIYAKSRDRVRLGG
jgi:hypothetical protein